MAGKARVHELAKEFGVTSKEVMARLAANGNWVKSASSTVEAPVARRLREAYGVPHPAPRSASTKDRQRAAGSIPTPLDVASGKVKRQRTATATTPQARLASGKRQSSRLTSVDALDIYRNYRRAATSEDPNQAIDALFRECEASYGISRSALRQLVNSDKLRRLDSGEDRREAAEDRTERNLRDVKPVRAQSKLPIPPQACVPQHGVGTSPTQPRSGTGVGKRRYDPITPATADDIYKRYRLASESENPSRARDALARECEAKYGLTARGLKRIVDSRKRLLPAGETISPSRRQARATDQILERPGTPQGGDPGDGVEFSSGGEALAITRPHARVVGLPPLAADLCLKGVLDIVAGKAERATDREAFLTSLQQLAPNGPEQYGYLAWRYAAIRPSHSEETLTSAHRDLIALAAVIEQERQLLDTLVRTHGLFLTNPALAERGLEEVLHRIINPDKSKRSASQELRVTRAAFESLRHALVLSIACTGNGQRLRGIVGRIKPPVEERVEMSPQLKRATRRLTDFIASVERLLSTDDANLTQFIRDSRASLAALQLKRYDFLRPFRDSAFGLRSLAHQATPDLAFQVLPQGEQLRKFLGEVRASKRYRGYRIDEHRLTVLEELQKHFGAQRCVWHRGSDSSDGIGIRYLVLAIKSDNGSGENAVAISPLAGRHATYVVRRDCAEADWKTLFAYPKFEARLRGARKLLFTDSRGDTDQYSVMRDKIIRLLECPPREFR